MRTWVVMCGGLLLAWAGGASAGVSLDRTRVIFQQPQRAAEVTVINRGSHNYLLQSAVLAVGNNEKPDTHFMIIPPLTRLGANKQVALRIIRRGKALPTDRESVSLLSVNAIPASVKNGGVGVDDHAIGASVALSMGLSIKLFYRPERLPMTTDESYGRLAFHYDGATLKVSNPTPYHQTFSSLKLGGKDVKLGELTTMVSPYGELTWTVAKGLSSAVSWQLINDYGGATKVFDAAASTGQAK